MPFKWSRSSKLSLGDGVQGSGGQRSVDNARWMMCDKRNSQYHYYFNTVKEILGFEGVQMSSVTPTSINNMHTSLTATSVHYIDSISL